MDVILGELTELINDVNPDVRRRGTQLDISIVTADDSHNCYYLKDIGNTENALRVLDDQIQLGHKCFYIGDYLDIVINYK